MHVKVRSHLDQAKSPRVKPALIDQFLNTANNFMYDQLCKTFQVNQQARDGLRALTVNDLPLTPTANVFTYPVNYMQETALQVLIGGVWQSSTPTTYLAKNLLPKNYFTQTSATSVKHIESDAGTTVYCGSNIVTSGQLSYIKKYPQMYWSQVAISASATALTVGVMYYVATSSVTHNAVTYIVGDTFTAVSAVLTGAGTVNAIQNSLLDDSLWEEMCTRAAAFISGSLEDYSRFQVKTSEENKS
jgi:hypothetical protein